MSRPSRWKQNVYKMSEGERERRGIKQLPGSLIEAIQLTEKSQMVREALGDHVFNHFIENKKVEWDRYRIQITSYEIEKYLPIL